MDIKSTAWAVPQMIDGPQDGPLNLQDPVQNY